VSVVEWDVVWVPRMVVVSVVGMVVGSAAV